MSKVKTKPVVSVVVLDVAAAKEISAEIMEMLLITKREKLWIFFECKPSSPPKRKEKSNT